MTMLTL